MRSHRPRILLFLISSFIADAVHPPSCTAHFDAGSTSSGIFSIQPEGAGGTEYQVYCDMSLDDGPWMLILAYDHEADDNTELNDGEIPLDPEEGYSHVNVNHFQGMSPSSIDAVRFYCTSDESDRVMHFRSEHPNIIEAAFDGDLSSNDVDYWTPSTDDPDDDDDQKHTGRFLGS